MKRRTTMRKIDFEPEKPPSTVHRHRTGIEGLDDLLNGGLKPGALGLLIGPSMSGRGTLARQYFYQGLKEDNASIYVTTKNFTEDIVTLMEEKKWTLDAYTEHYVVVFDSIDTVLMYVSAQGVYRFLSYLRAKIKGFRSSSMFMIEPDLHEERQVRTLFQLADVIVELKPDEGIVQVTQPGLPKRRGAFRVGETGCIVVPEPLD
jgi:KaiC/GvpD/RAD55 family RecA-like ATPase